MKWFYNLKTAHKLGLGFGLCAFLTLVIGIAALSRMGQMQSSTQNLVDNGLGSSKLIGDLIGDVTAYRVHEYRHLLIGSDKRAAVEKELDDLKTHVDNEFTDAKKFAATQEEKETLSQAQQTWKVFIADRDDQIALGRKGDTKNGVALMMSRMPAYVKIKDALIAFRKLEETGASGMAAQSAATYASARSTTITLIFGAMITGVLIAVVMTRYMVGTVKQVGIRLNSLAAICLPNLAKAVDALAEGDVTCRIETGTKPLQIDTKDEFGVMGADLNQMIEQIQHTIAAFEIAQDQLSQMLAQAKGSSESMAAASAEVSTGNSDLAQRTEEQASSLEETAASMEEITATVKQNADNSKLADQLANQAKQVAEEGGTVVRSAVSAMGEINEGSKRIAEIVSVIDDIAFQTNLLALNAAVEAARVGEQGRGFAVVAAEVRSLAGRSATAAKEIKVLVQDSVSKVQSGSSLVNESGTRLEEIVSSVKKVADVIAEISAASLEQAAGIEQVNKAIMQMDQVTQQNAALVEEVSATSHSMSQGAQGLQQLVSKFTVNPKYLLTVQQAEIRPVPLAATGTTGRSEAVASAPRKRSKAKLTVVKNDDAFESF